MPSATVNAHSAVHAPRKANWARRTLGFRALLANAPAAAASLLPKPPSATMRRYAAGVIGSVIQPLSDSAGTSGSGRERVEELLRLGQLVGSGLGRFVDQVRLG